MDYAHKDRVEKVFARDRPLIVVVVCLLLGVWLWLIFFLTQSYQEMYMSLSIFEVIVLLCIAISFLALSLPTSFMYMQLLWKPVLLLDQRGIRYTFGWLRKKNTLISWEHIDCIRIVSTSGKIERGGQLHTSYVPAIVLRNSTREKNPENFFQIIVAFYLYMLWRLLPGDMSDDGESDIYISCPFLPPLSELKSILAKYPVRLVDFD